VLGLHPLLATMDKRSPVPTKKLRGRSPQAKYTDRATAACRRSQCQPLRVEGVAWSASTSII
jgi:hypothetical protein